MNLPYYVSSASFMRCIKKFFGWEAARLLPIPGN